MKAAVLTEQNDPLVMADLKLPALGIGQVLVRMEYAAICGSQLNEIAGTKGIDRYTPHLLGHEGIGQVEAIGPGVTTKTVGDWVICHWRPSDGIAAQGVTYDWNGVTVNAGPMACFAEQCIVSENRLTKLPEGVDHRTAPLYGCGLTTSFGVIANDAQVKIGDSVIVFGAGGVGLLVVQMAALAGAHPIIAIDPVPQKRAMAMAAGALDALDRYDLPFAFDIAIDTTGRSEVIQNAYRATTPKGKVVLVGVPDHRDPITIHSLPLHFGKILTGSHGGGAMPHEDIPRLAKLVRAGKLKLDGLITHEFELERINEALDLVRSGTAGRVLIRMGV